jgi:dTDP-4-dehydrorhamnose 3,5-epimerase
MLWIPPGFAHGFMVLSQGAEVLYKATDFYAPQHERTILWDDPTLQITWPRSTQAILSVKDLAGSTLEHAAVYEQPLQQLRIASAQAVAR